MLVVLTVSLSFALFATCSSRALQKIDAAKLRAGNPQLTKRAGLLGECERLATAGHQGAHSALFAATAVLFRRAQFPRYWPFPTKRGRGLSTESADELEVGDIWLRKGAEVRGHPQETARWPALEESLFGSKTISFYRL